MNIGLTYRREGNCLVPNLDLDGQPEAPLGKYGLLRQAYLREHRPVLWTRLCVSGQSPTDGTHSEWLSYGRIFLSTLGINGPQNRVS